MSSSDDKLDRLLISFKDAKVPSILFSQVVLNLSVDCVAGMVRHYLWPRHCVYPHLRALPTNGMRQILVKAYSLNFFQQTVLDSHLFRAELRADPLSRCAALSLPKDSLAILPFYQSQAELDVMEQDQSLARYFVTCLSNQYRSSQFPQRSALFSLFRLGLGRGCRPESA